MRKILYLILSVLVLLNFSCAKENNKTKVRIALFISEQNIQGPQRAWWLSEIDLSTIESAIAQRLIQEGYEIIDPSLARDKIKLQKAFKAIDLNEEESIKLGELTRADFVLVGKAVASAGGNIPQSNMRSCFANATAKLIKVKEKKFLGYLEAEGVSTHLDLITGGKEALKKAGESLSLKVIEILSKEKEEK